MENDPLLLENRDKLIEENKGFIYSTAFKVCKRNLDWLNDDELSIALIAFNSACDSYKSNKGNFLGYASVLIRNSLIDFFRKSKDTPYLIFDDDSDKDINNYIDNKSSLIEFEKEQENSRKAEEIAMFSVELSKYKLSLEDLLQASPSHIDTRSTLLNIAFKCSKREDILSHIKSKKCLPLKQMVLFTGTNRKFFEKWRRYILVLILIISGNEYPYIKSYLNIKVGESHE